MNDDGWATDGQPYGTVRWFGPSWGAPVNDPVNQIGTPVGELCIYCETKIEDERTPGISLPYSSGSTVVRVAYHRDCFLGSLGIPTEGDNE